MVESASLQEGKIKLINGGCLDFWTLENEDAGRGRKYKRVILDECGLARYLKRAWEYAIRPTLSDLEGDSWMLGTPKGRAFFHQCFERGRKGDPGWKSWRGRINDNPVIPPEEIEEMRRQLPEQAASQELDGIPAEDAGNPFGLSHIAECIRDGPPSGRAAVYGIDLARSVDYTVVIGLDDNGRVCRFERWHQVPWRETMSRIRGIIGDAPTLADSTGVGDAIVEELSRDCPNVEGFSFAGKGKQQIMEGLAVSIQHHRIGFPEGPISIELEQFQYEYGAKGHVFYSAPEGLHDDCVCALALANHHWVERQGGAGVVVIPGGRVARLSAPADNDAERVAAEFREAERAYRRAFESGAAMGNGRRW